MGLYGYLKRLIRILSRRYKGYTPALPNAHQQGFPTGVTGPPTYEERRLYRDLRARGLVSGRLTPESIQQMRDEGWVSGPSQFPSREEVEAAKAERWARDTAAKKAGRRERKGRSE